ncbi:TonB family protein [Antarctobacter sp.]|uniref:TonB family protein n=1 Tax=Antarctobacter sp. TaxID=1872577 RepID=UPI002B26F74D|nr:TonB family protein [Antarctobacter sp.]
MIASSRLAKTAALSLALVAHGAIALTLSSPQEAQIDGAPGGPEVRLGTSFADMSAGRVAPEPAEDTAERADPDKTDPDRAKETAEKATPEKTDPEPPKDTAEKVTPEETRPARPRDTIEKPDRTTVAAKPAATGPALRHANDTAIARPLNPVAPSSRALPVKAEAGVALAVRQPDKGAPDQRAALTPTAAPTRVSPLSPDKAAPVTASAPRPLATSESADPISPAAAPVHRLTGEAPKSAAVSRSLRPRVRSPGFEAAHKPVAKPKPTPKPKAVPPKGGGGAKHNTRAGELTGNRAAKSPTSGAAGRKAATGNASASNYPGLVMRKLSRAGRPKVNARGTAVVSFTVTSSGGLASVSLSRSSGSSTLDRAALQVVRNAAPFPPPPSGARRGFAIQIKGH